MSNPAFPFYIVHESDKETGAPVKSSFCPGMDLRDYFAAKAMQSIIAADGIQYARVAAPEHAALAYTNADAMLSVRSKQGASTERDELLAALMDARKELWDVHHSHMSEAEFHSRFANIDAAIRKAEGRQP